MKPEKMDVFLTVSGPTIFFREEDKIIRICLTSQQSKQLRKKLKKQEKRLE